MEKAGSSGSLSEGPTWVSKPVIQVVAQWVVLGCLFALACEQGASFALLFICFCVAFSLELLATFVQIFALRVAADKDSDLRPLGQALSASLFVVSLATLSIPGAVRAGETPFSLFSVKGLFIFILCLAAVASAIQFAMMVKRALHARGDTSLERDGSPGNRKREGEGKQHG